MILTTHALVGAAIGKEINNPWLVVFLSLLFHFILDSFRHGEYLDDRYATIKKDGWKVITDFGISVIIIFLFLKYSLIGNAKNIILGSVFSVLPDMTSIAYWKYKFIFLGPIKKFHSWCHYYAKFPKYSPERAWTLRNAANDIAISLLAILILFIK